jgi:hypothetical protein
MVQIKSLKPRPGEMVNGLRRKQFSRLTGSFRCFCGTLAECYKRNHVIVQVGQNAWIGF